MQRMQQITKWKKLEHGQAQTFADGPERRIRLDVNAPDMVQLWYSDGDGVTTFLANVIGRDVIEFHSHGGTFSIHADGGELWYYTVDGEVTSVGFPESVSFARVAERRVMSMEAQMIRYEALRNREQMQEYMQLELRRMEQSLRKSIEAEKAPAAKPAAEGDGKPTGKKSEPKAASAGDEGVDEPDGSGGAAGGGKPSK